MEKSEVLNGALALNSDDKNYTVEVQGNCIVTKIKWMDATFFSPTAVTDDMRSFEYIVELDDKKRYSEVDEVYSSSSQIGLGGIKVKKSFFIGKQIEFNKVIGVGKNKIDGSEGVVDVKFYTNDFKRPIREYLESCGYKRKMNIYAKFILIGFAVMIPVAAVIIGILMATGALKKEPVSVEDFINAVENSGLYAEDCSYEQSGNEYVDAIFVAENDDMHLEIWDMIDSSAAENMFDGNCEGYKDAYLGFCKASSGLNYAKSEVDGSNDRTAVFYRIEDKYIFGETDTDSKEQLLEVVKGLGY